MTVKFSSYALEKMGFCEILNEGGLSASFMSMNVYEACGITVPESFAEAREAHVAGASYRISISDSVNAGSPCLVSDHFTESESEWLKEVKATGPFVLIAVGPTDFIECEAGSLRRLPDGSISTYDSFPGHRETLRSLEDRILPVVVATLTLALNAPDCYVYLHKLARASAGRTQEGTTIHDVRYDAQIEITVATALGAVHAAGVLDSSTKRAPKLHQRSARPFALGTAEDDQLKKFLFFFLSLEIETKAVFDRIDHAKSFAARLRWGTACAASSSASELIVRKLKKGDNLFDKFVWCATCAWPSLTDEDIDLFKELKEARDAIAHGKASEPPAGFARKAELLAHKVLWSFDVRNA